MIKKLLAVGSSSLLMASAFALPAFAAGPVAGVVSNTDAMVTGSVGVSGMGSSTSGSAADVGVGVTVQTGTTTMTTTSTTTSSAGSDTTIMLSNTDPAVVNFTAGSDQVTTAANVQTDDQLSSYAAHMMSNDKNVQNVSLGSTAVTMDYKGQGELFGFIPVSITEHATVNQDGTVSVTYPWYHFLVSTDPNTQAELQASVQDNASSMSANAQFSAQARATIMQDMYNVFSGHSS